MKKPPCTSALAGAPGYPMCTSVRQVRMFCTLQRRQPREARAALIIMTL